MSRADKKITPGRLDGPATPSRGRSWTKYGGIESVDGRDGAPTEVVVDLSDAGKPDAHSTAVTSKYMERSFGAQLPPLPDADDEPEVVITTEWVMERSIDGRTYRRHDELVTTTVQL